MHGTFLQADGVTEPPVVMLTAAQGPHARAAATHNQEKSRSSSIPASRCTRLASGKLTRDRFISITNLKVHRLQEGSSGGFSMDRGEFSGI